MRIASGSDHAGFELKEAAAVTKATGKAAGNRPVRRSLLAALVLVVTVASGAWAAATQQPAVPPRDVWPRQMQLSNATATIYQPQVDRWVLNRVDFHAAIGVKAQGSGDESFGVIWGSTAARVDRVARLVVLGDVILTKSNFPTLPDSGAAYLAELRTQLPRVARTIALDRIEASLGASEEASPPTVPVNNDPPQILVSYSPAVLVAIGGEPVWRPLRATHYERIVNTRVLVLREKRGGVVFLHVYNGWLVADTLDGPWSVATHLPKQIDAVARDLAADGAVDLLDGGTTPPKPSFATGVPTIYVRQKPAELIVFKGPPDLQAIKGTALFRAANTTADVIVRGVTSAYYVLISGRWYTAPSIDQQWSYIPSANLPGDFRLIPASSPAGVVLAAIAGTPQAREAAIANSIPQTATVTRATAPAFSPIYDGPPQLRPIDGTALQYVVNSPTPIILVDEHSGYAVRAGVWYTATALDAPWTLATSVPDAIYTIPSSSPLHFVTYARIYGATPAVVYEGYTPGYLGTVVAPDGVVVYGTGYDYPQWVGNMWCASPATYGMQAQPVYNPALGWTYGFGLGATTAAFVSSYGGTPYYRPTSYSDACCASAGADVYGSYGDRGASVSTAGVPQASGGSTTAGNARGAEPTRTAGGATGTGSGGDRYTAPTGTFPPPPRVRAPAVAGLTEEVQGDTVAYVYRPQQADAKTTAAPNTGINPPTDAAAVGTPGAAPDTTKTDTDTGGALTYYNGAWQAGSNNVYADTQGTVYRSTGNGWQQNTSTGWQDTAVGDASWQAREQEARVEADNRYTYYYQGGWGWSYPVGYRAAVANRWAAGGYGDRFGGSGRPVRAVPRAGRR
jgi:hypothetical protein